MFGMLKNGQLIKNAEKMMNDFLAMNSDDYTCGIIITNPDGTKVALQKGFTIDSYEYTFITEREK